MAWVLEVLGSALGYIFGSPLLVVGFVVLWLLGRWGGVGRRVLWLPVWRFWQSLLDQREAARGR